MIFNVDMKKTMNECGFVFQIPSKKGVTLLNSIFSIIILTRPFCM